MCGGVFQFKTSLKFFLFFPQFMSFPTHLPVASHEADRDFLFFLLISTSSAPCPRVENY